MATKKPQNKNETIQTLTGLEYEQCVDALDQFGKAYPDAAKQKEFLGISVGFEGGQPQIKITVTQLGAERFEREMALPSEFEATFPGARALLKITIYAAPILTSAAPKSAASKKTAPVFPVKS
jgi:hypothetical protein